MANTSNPLRQLLNEFHEQCLYEHRYSYATFSPSHGSCLNEAFDHNGLHYWRYRGQCWYSGEDGVPHSIDCERYYALQKEAESPEPTVKQTKSFKSAYDILSEPDPEPSPRISPDRINHVAKQKKFEVLIGNSKIPLTSVTHSSSPPASVRLAEQSLKNIGIDPVVVSERMLAGIADTAEFTHGEISYGSDGITLSYYNALDDEVEFERTFTKDKTGSLTVKHDRFFLPPSKQKGGNAARMMRDALSLYRELDVSHITIDAVKSGKYVWLKCCFTPYKDYVVYIADSILKFLPEVRRKFSDIPLSVFGEIKDCLNEMKINPRAAWDLVNISEKMPDGKQTVVYYLLANYVKAWQGELDMNDDVAVDRCQQYIDSKLDDFSNYSLDIEHLF